MAVAQVGTLVTFAAGSTAVAADVNQNFTDIKTAINNLITGADEITVGGVVITGGGITTTATVTLGTGAGLQLENASIIRQKDSGGTYREMLRTDAGDIVALRSAAGGIEFEALDGTTRLLMSDAGAFDFQAGALTTTGKLTSGEAEINGDLNHDGSNAGFYGTAPIAQQTGVAVSAAGVHAACVALGLFTA